MMARIIALKNHPKLGWILKDRSTLSQVATKWVRKVWPSWPDFCNNFRSSWAEVSEEIRPMMGLISWAATSFQVGTKLKSLANLTRLFVEAGLLTCGQVGHKLKNGVQVDHHFQVAERLIQFNLNWINLCSSWSQVAPVRLHPKLGWSKRASTSGQLVLK